MINVSQSSNSLPPHAAAYTLIELLVTITVIIILGTMVLGKIGAAGSIAEKKVIYLQNRDTLVAMANDHEWNYVDPIDPNAGRMPAE